MALHVLEQEQVLPVTLEEAWSFFSTPRNLARITPPDMGFVIHEPFDDSPAHAGQRITYTVRPLFGIPLKWVTLIALAEGPHRFVDSQVKGPYKHWWHLHTFEKVEGGVLMRDRVEYELPLGPLGELAHGIFVKKRLQQIFEHRRETLKRLFPAPARTN
jgi:ligand-binding SRPBCC domain-containing protein